MGWRIIRARMRFTNSLNYMTATCERVLVELAVDNRERRAMLLIQSLSVMLEAQSMITTVTCYRCAEISSYSITLGSLCLTVYKVIVFLSLRKVTKGSG